MREVVIIGPKHHNTYGVIRSLGKKGIKPTVVLDSDTDDCFFAKSRYIGSISHIPVPQMIDHLTSHVAGGDEKPVLICCSDTLSSLVDLNRDLLADKYMIPGASRQGAITHLMNKQNMSELAEKCGLNIPPHTQTIERDELMQKKESMPYPCILKPLVSAEGHKSDIMICTSPEQLAENISQIDCKHLQVQKFIDKTMEYQIIGCSLLADNEIFTPGGVKLRLAASPRSNTGIVTLEPLEKLNIDIAPIKAFIQATGYSGLFSVEFIRDSQGRDYFMEMNFRNDGNAIVMTAGGANLPYMWYLYNTDGDWRDLCGKKIKKATAVPLFPMLSWLKSRPLYILSKSLTCSVFMDIDFCDPKTTCRQLATLVTILKTQLVKRIKR